MIFSWWTCAERVRNVRISVKSCHTEEEGWIRRLCRTSDRIKISLSKDASVELYLVLSTSWARERADVSQFDTWSLAWLWCKYAIRHCSMSQTKRMSYLYSDLFGGQPIYSAINNRESCMCVFWLKGGWAWEQVRTNQRDIYLPPTPICSLTSNLSWNSSSLCRNTISFMTLSSPRAYSRATESARRLHNSGEKNPNNMQ